MPGDRFRRASTESGWLDKRSRDDVIADWGTLVASDCTPSVVLAEVAIGIDVFVTGGSWSEVEDGSVVRCVSRGLKECDGDDDC